MTLPGVAIAVHLLGVLGWCGLAFVTLVFIPALRNALQDGPSRLLAAVENRLAPQARMALILAGLSSGYLLWVFESAGASIPSPGVAAVGLASFSLSACAFAGAGDDHHCCSSCSHGYQDIMTIIQIIFAFLLPPMAVYLQVGLGWAFWVNIGFTLLGYIPGIVHALWVIWPECGLLGTAC